jgi:protocatechuate 3,4-dioxygenase beta subunit
MSAPFGIPAGPVPVAGRIHTVAGQPVPEAVLTVLDAHGNADTTGHSDPDGSFQLTAHADRAHLLLVTAPGYEPTAFSLPADRVPAPLDLTLTAVIAVHGTICDADTAKPLGDAVVTVATSRGDVLATAHAGPAGRYMFTSVPPGIYTLVATAAGHHPAARTLTISAGNPAIEHDLPLTAIATATLTGIVHTPSGQPVADVEVRAHRAGTDPAVAPAAITHTAADGRFQFTGLPPDRYSVHAPGHVPATTSVALTGPEPHAADFALHATRYSQPPMPGLPAGTFAQAPAAQAATRPGTPRHGSPGPPPPRPG